MKATNYLLLVLISLIWGAQFLFNDIALKDFSPLWVATARCIIGAVTLTLVLPFIKNRPADKPKNPMSPTKIMILLFFIGLFEATLPFYLVAWGQQHVESSVAAILIGTVPIFTAIFVGLFVKSEHIHKGTVLSVLVGFIGLAVLVGPDLMAASGSLMKDIAGELAILIGAISFALSLTLIRYLSHNSPVHAARGVLAWASLQMIILTLLFDHKLPTEHTWQAIGSLLVLGIFCAGVVYVFYVALITRAGAAFASFSNYLVPLVGVILGVTLLSNKMHWYEILALIIIFVAMIINEVLAPKQ